MSMFKRDRLLRYSPLLAVVATALLLLAGVTGAWLAERDYREQKIEQANAHARVLAASVSAALAFQDPAEARRAVNALNVNPEVVAVGIYAEDGTLFAGDTSDDRALPQTFSEVARAPYSEGYARARADVTESQSRLGTVYVELSTDAGAARWMRYIGIFLLLIMASLMIALVAAAQRALGAANLELERRADALAESNTQLTLEVAERQKAQTALAQAQKMEAIGQLTGGVAHDFNNLLMVISSGLRLLESREDPQKRANIVASMRQAVDRGAGLTKQLLAFSRRQKLSPEVVVVQQRIENLRTLLERSLREDIALKLDFDSNDSAVKLDPSQFDLAVLNLAVNARDAMPGGGLVSIRVRNQRNAEGDFAVVSVSDNGVGMPADVAARAFDPFFTTKEVGKGTGLGLSQVYGFVLQSGGRCEIESTEGAGTTITLILPLTDEPAPERIVSAEPKAIETGVGAILVVEDDDSVASLVCEMIGDLGYSATRVPNAHEALSRIERGLPVDAVFSDIIMPGGLNGIELATELRKRRPDLPILLTTGYSGHGVTEVQDFPVLRKPYDREELGAALAQLRPH
ncbi:MAG: hybrid sensor histidine kinase/response regulator [Alphaproteobacteria bacterium]|nr:MAG: hybrid sensor histidine kinase/response regulator [Alphaproteobacteria bacterium]